MIDNKYIVLYSVNAMLICGSEGSDIMLVVQRTGSSPDTTLVCSVHSFIFQYLLCPVQGQCGSDENSVQIRITVEVGAGKSVKIFCGGSMDWES